MGLHADRPSGSKTHRREAHRLYPVAEPSSPLNHVGEGRTPGFPACMGSRTGPATPGYDAAYGAEDGYLDGQLGQRVAEAGEAAPPQAQGGGAGLGGSVRPSHNQKDRKLGQPVEERIQLVRILLSSFFDYLPSPVTSSGLVARSAVSGPAPGKRVPCTYCRRSGRVRVRHGSRYCPVCDGSGWRARRRLNPSHPEYEQPWDEYTREPVTEEQVQHPPVMTRHQLDRALDQLEEYERGERFGWEREREVYERRGSYVELALALDQLAARWSQGYVQVRRQYLRGLAFEPSAASALLCDAAEEWIAREMRGRIRVPRWLSEEVSEARQATVYELQAQGLTAGQIARRLRIPKLKVQRLLRSVTLTAEVLTGASGKART